jgi:hypothetical protein
MSNRLTRSSLAPAPAVGDDRGTMRRAIALTAAASLAGCGLTMTSGPAADRPPGQRPVCTETMDAPKRDAYGALAGLLAILVGGLLHEADENEDLGTGLIVGGAVVAVASYASGGIGYYRVKRCQRAVADWQRGL